MWVDVSAGYGGKWKAFFQELQAHHGLDPSNNAHRWLLHFLFLPSINQDAQAWRRAWNSHKLTVPGESSASPNERFLFDSIHWGLPSDPNPAADVDTDSYGIDWHDLDLPTIITHYLSRNYPPGSIHNPFKSSPPSSFHHLDVQDPNMPLNARELHCFLSYLAIHCDTLARSMGARVTLWCRSLAFLIRLLDERGLHYPDRD